MIHYHGSPLTPEHAAAQVYAGRHAMVSFAHPAQLPLIADVCQSFALDNGAFSAWRSGKPVSDWEPFYKWVDEWRRHPGFDWYLIPDVIDGDEDANDELIATASPNDGVPVWHLHESLDRLEKLAFHWPRVAFGSSGEYATVGSPQWWHRMAEAMDVVCDGGRPCVKLHGLRMLSPRIFTRFPFASADSTNVARNTGLDGKWRGTYAPTSPAIRGIVLASRVEAMQSAPRWHPLGTQDDLDFDMSCAPPELKEETL